MFNTERKQTLRGWKALRFQVKRAALALALTVLTTATAWAQDAITGLTYNSTGGYYEINDAQDLIDLATYVNAGNNASGKTFKQTQDIDMSSAGNFEPIGSQPNSYNPTPFNGTYDGQGHAITGLTVNISSPYAGLFGYMTGGTVRNLTMVNPNVTANYYSLGGKYAGGIVGAIQPGTIENCNVINPTLNPSSAVKGAICGNIGSDKSNISGCYFYTTGNVSAEGANKVGVPVSASRAYTLTLNDGITTSTAPAFSYGGTGYYASGTTITLPAAPIGWVYYTVNGSAIDGNTFDISADASVTVNKHISSLLGYDDDPLVDGSAEHPYIISTADGWNLFCDCLNDNTTWNRFSGKTVKLGDDITVTRMAGGSYHDFCGTFDGQGNTLTVNISSDDITDGSTQYVAPFRYVTSGDSPATIRNLHVTGTITTAKQFTGGLIGGCWGTVIVENCRVSTAITSTISGDGTHGGIVGIQQNGSLYIHGCVFDGSLLGATTYAVGGFVGWRKSGAEIRNSLFAPTAVTIQNTSCATFSRNKIDTYNSYYTYYLCDGTNYAPYDPADADHPDKYNNGHMRRTITAGDNVTIDAVALTGDTTQYRVSGITAYSGGGLQRGETLYYGSGDQLSLTLSSTGAPQGYCYDGYTASAGTLSGTTLTMPDADVTISVDTDVLRSTGQPVSVSYIDANGQPAFHDAIALDGTETNLAAGWYFVQGTVNYTEGLVLDGDTHIILADGSAMNIGTEQSPVENVSPFYSRGFFGYQYDLSIYAQSGNTGSLSIYSNDSFGVNNLTIAGGNIHCNSSSAFYQNSGNIVFKRANIENTNGGSLAIGADNLTATDCQLQIEASESIIQVDNAITFNNVSANLSGSSYGVTCANFTVNHSRLEVFVNQYVAIHASGIITLGCTDATDYIKTNCSDSNYWPNSYSGTVKIADGQAFTDGNGHIYTGTLTNGEKDAIGGKTLSPLQAISYIAADGKTRQCTDFTVLTGNETELDNTDGWYVAAGTLNYDHTLILSADVNLILTDGCQMNFGTSESRLDCYGINYTGYPTLNIYGQSTGDNMGTLSAYTTGNETHAIRAYGLSINGGNVVANAIGDDANGLDVYDDLIVNDGNVIATATGYSATAISTEYDLHVNGGNVTATVNGESAFAICVAMNKFEVNGGKVMVTVTGDNATAICHHTEYRSLFAGGTITVMGANDNGNIYLNGATVTFSSYGGYMEVGEGLFYTDGEGNYYYGELTSSEMSAIAGKTLSPSSSPAISLADTDAELNQKLLALDGVTLDVTLANRTIDTEWNTLTVPFIVTYWQLIETFGKGVKLYELTGSSLVGDVLGLEFTSATSIEVGKPYFIKASADVVNPTFHDVTIDAWANSTSATDYVDFVPTLGVSEIQGDRITDVLVLGGNNTLYNPASLPAKMKAFRGYFRVHDYSPAAEAMQFRMTFNDATEDDVTGIVQIENSKLKGDHSDAIYNLMGVRVKSADKGLFIVKGKKIIVK